MNKLVSSLLIWLCASPFSQAQTHSTLPNWAGRYDTIRQSDDVFIVTKSRKMGIVNTRGTALTKLVYDTIFNFREGIAIVGRSHREVNQFGKVSSDVKYGYLTKVGRLVVPIQYEHIEDFSEGLGYVLPSLREDYWFDKHGKLALALGQLCSAGSFQGNMAFVQLPKIGFKRPPDYPGQLNPNDVRGNYIDHAGRLLIPWKYDTIAPYQPGYLRPVRKNGKWGFLDSLARVAVPLQYDDIDTDSAFFWQSLRRVGAGKRFGFLNPKTGELVVPLRYEAMLPSQRSVLWVRQHGRWGTINYHQQAIISPRYDEAMPFDAFGLTVVKTGGLYGLVNEQGRELSPCRYERILPFQDGRAVVKRAERFGFIATDGHEIIPAVYDEVSPFTDGRAFAKRWGLFITLNPNGDWLGWKLQTSTFQGIIGALLLLAGLRIFRSKLTRVFALNH